MRQSRSTGVCTVAFALISALNGTSARVNDADVSQQARNHNHALHSQAATMHARGTFEVKITPLPVDDYTDATALGRMTIDKQSRGDLVGTGKGQMLTGMGAVKGSAAYSAIERFTGTVAGKRGSFVMQHTGIMTRGAQSLVITIVPDTGTEELAGISGTLAIIIEGKQHSYDLEYTIAAQ